MVTPLPQSQKEEPPAKKGEDPAFAVMQITLENPLGWDETWGVIPSEGNPQNGADWIGLFPSKEAAERFRKIL